MQRAQQGEENDHKPIAKASPKIKLCACADEPKARYCACSQCACQCAKPSGSKTVEDADRDNPVTDTMIHHVDDTAQIGVKSRSAVVRSAVFWPNCHPKSGCVYDLNVGEVPSAPSSLFLNPRHPSSAVRSAVKERLDGDGSLRAARWDVPPAFSFCAR